MLEKEYSYFESMRDQLLKEHLREYVAIKDNEIIGFYLNKIEALKELSNRYELGTVLIQQCIPEEADTQVLHTRAVI